MILPMDKYRAFSWMCLRDFSERTKFASIFTSLDVLINAAFVQSTLLTGNIEFAIGAQIGF